MEVGISWRKPVLALGMGSTIKRIYPCELCSGSVPGLVEGWTLGAFFRRTIRGQDVKSLV